MDTALLDVAFGLVSHSIISQEARFHTLTTDEARLAELRRQFPQADPRALEDAYARARQLEKVAIEVADAARDQRKGQSEPLLDPEALGALSRFFGRELLLGHQ